VENILQALRGTLTYFDKKRNKVVGYEAVKHQRFVGTGYFDMVTQVIASGNSSTTALAGSTEAELFAPSKAQAGAGPEEKSEMEERASVTIVLPEMERTRVRM
jgi:hypothetical protein